MWNEVTVLYVVAFLCTAKKITLNTDVNKYCASIGSCSLDADCLQCTFPTNCRLMSKIEVNCSSVSMCTTSVSVKKPTLCMYCWQSPSSMHDCIMPSNCSTNSAFMIETDCKVHPSVVCLGHRSFRKKLPCSWTSGISWSKSLFLSITLGGFGADRFYLGLWKSAIGKLFSFGGLGVWTLVDVVLIAVGYIKPADGSLYT